jgi:hypothetical protein
MEKYIKEYIQELDPFLMEEAKSISYKDWFDLGRTMSNGKLRGTYSPQTWATIMRNMFDWDKENKEPESKYETHAEAIFNAWKGNKKPLPQTGEPSA